MTTELEQTQLEIAKLQLEQERHKLAQMKKRQRVADDLSQGAVAVGGAAAKGGRRVLVWFGKLLLALGVVFALAVTGEMKNAVDPTWDFSYRVGFAAGRLSDAAYGWMLLAAAVAASIPWRSNPGQEMSFIKIVGWAVFGFVAMAMTFWLFARAR